MEEKKYIMVLWPYSQIFMEHPRFKECYLVQSLEGQEHLNSVYFISEDIYGEIYDELNSLRSIKPFLQIPIILKRVFFVIYSACLSNS